MLCIPKLRLSSFVLSATCYDNANSPADQEGFIIGKVQTIMKSEISDQSMDVMQEELSLCVHACIPCGQFLSFYDGQGNLYENTIKDFVGERSNEIIGWYRFRRNLLVYPSARELHVHENLTKYFSGNISAGDEYFTFGVFTSAYVPSNATHTSDYAFFIKSQMGLKALPIIVANLGDTKTPYRQYSASQSFIDSPTFETIVKDYSENFSSSWATEDTLQKLHTTLREKCGSLTDELVASDSINAAIEQDIKRLENELQRLTSTGVFDDDSSDSDVCTVDSEKTALSTSLSQPPTSKRTLADLEKEKKHPLFGRFFQQNRDGNDEIPVAKPCAEKTRMRKTLPQRRIEIEHDYDAPAEIYHDEESNEEEEEEEAKKDIPMTSEPKNETPSKGAPYIVFCRPAPPSDDKKPAET